VDAGSWPAAPSACSTQTRVSAFRRWGSPCVLVFLAGLFWWRAAGRDRRRARRPDGAGRRRRSAPDGPGRTHRRASICRSAGSPPRRSSRPSFARRRRRLAPWTALDRLSLRIGRPVDEARIPAGIAGLAEILSLYAPGSSVAAWKQAADGTVRTSHSVAGDGTCPSSRHFPPRPSEGDGWLVLPVVDEGAVVGALGNRTHERASARTSARWPKAIAATRQFGRREGVAVTDPVSARLNLAQESVRRALQRAQQWEAALESSETAIGLFDVSGGLVSAGGTVRSELGADAVPLFQAIRNLTSQGRRRDPRSTREGARRRRRMRGSTRATDGTRSS
jgi:hypothetical protein